MSVIERTAVRAARYARWHMNWPTYYIAQGRLHDRAVVQLDGVWRWWITGQRYARIIEGEAATLADARAAADAASLARLRTIDLRWQLNVIDRGCRQHRFWTLDSLDIGGCITDKGADASTWLIYGLSDAEWSMHAGTAGDGQAAMEAAADAARACARAEIAAITATSPVPVFPRVCRACGAAWVGVWPQPTNACPHDVVDYHDPRAPCTACATAVGVEAAVG